MTDLLPCPFCGHKCAPMSKYDTDSEGHFVHCDFRDHGCGASTSWEFTCRVDAVKAWNTRTNTAGESK